VCGAALSWCVSYGKGFQRMRDVCVCSEGEQGVERGDV